MATSSGLYWNGSKQQQKPSRGMVSRGGSGLESGIWNLES